MIKLIQIHEYYLKIDKILLLYILEVSNSNQMLTLHDATNGTQSNVTASAFLTVNELAPFWFLHVLPLSIILLGLIGNTITVFVLCKKKYASTSTCFYMKMLAFSDNTLMILFFIRWLKQLADVDINEDFFCITYFFAKRVTLGASGWILMLMTLDKYLCSRFPLHAKRLCTIKRARVCLFVIMSVYVIAHLPYFWRYSNINAITLSDKCPIKLAENFVRMFTIFRITLLDNVLPWLLTTLFTILMSRELYIMSKKSASVRIRTIDKKIPKKVKYMAIFDSWAFFFLTFPAAALDLTRLFITIKSDKMLFILYETFVYLLHINSAVHFYFYVMVSKNFRNDVSQLFSKKRP